MTRPTEYPYWATILENDPVTGTPNREVPSLEKQNYGQRANKNTRRQDINYLFNRIREHIQFFDEQDVGGNIYIHAAASAPTLLELADRFGGVWEYIDGATGADTLAGQNVIVYKRTDGIPE